MSTSTIVQNAMSDNLAFSLMARLHVILRRQNGRVTDIEYMRVNPAYCRAILDLSLGLPNTDLHDICLKLEDIYFGEDGLFVAQPPAGPLLARLSSAQKLRPKAPALEDDSIMQVPMPLPDHNTMVDQTYIGRLR